MFYEFFNILGKSQSFRIKIVREIRVITLETRITFSKVLTRLKSVILKDVFNTSILPYPHMSFEKLIEKTRKEPEK